MTDGNGNTGRAVDKGGRAYLLAAERGGSICLISEELGERLNREMERIPGGVERKLMRFGYKERKSERTASNGREQIAESPRIKVKETWRGQQPELHVSACRQEVVTHRRRESRSGKVIRHPGIVGPGGAESIGEKLLQIETPRGFSGDNNKTDAGDSDKAKTPEGIRVHGRSGREGSPASVPRKKLTSIAC